MGQTETTPLLAVSEGQVDDEKTEASVSESKFLSSLMLALIIVLIVFYSFGTDYSDIEYSTKEYVAFRDIMAMLLLGFGYLMTFLKHYGLGAVGFTMMFSVFSMLVNIPIELLLRYLFGVDGEDTAWPIPLGMSTIIDAEFAAATLMISFGALIGRASPLQMMLVLLSEAFFYAFNKVFLVLGVIGAEDVGGSMTIHMFGAVFGLAVSFALGEPKDAAAAIHGEPDKVSDVFALIGTTILWVFWPSFVGATETGVPENEMKCVINTIMALLGSSAASFYVSHRLTHGKFDPVHIANSTLAGGVAIGSAGRLGCGPGGSLLLGVIAGAASVYGYVYSTPFLESKFHIYDTCGVGNLHGIPSVIGALFSIVFVCLDRDAAFLSYDWGSQVLRQGVAIVATLAIAALSGYGTGRLIAGQKDERTSSYLDAVWWHAEYFDSKDL